MQFHIGSEDRTFRGGASVLFNRRANASRQCPQDDSYINAFDLTKLDFAWRDKQIGGRQAWAGVMTTAGGLVAFGNDTKSSRWMTLAPASRYGRSTRAANACLTHVLRIDGKQYFAVAAGDDVFAFALP